MPSPLRDNGVVAASERPARVLAFGAGRIPSVYLFVEKPLRLLQTEGKIELRDRSGFRLSNRDLEWADVFVFCRNNAPEDLSYLRAAKAINLPIIYIIDDNFLEAPLAYVEGRRLRTPIFLYTLKNFLRAADLVITFSETLAEDLRLFSDKVAVRNTYFASKSKPDISAHNRERVRITFASSRSEDGSIEPLLFPILRDAIDKYRERIEIVLWKPLFGLKGNNIVVKNALPYEDYLEELSSGGYDIGLAPAVDNRFFNSKNETKYREYGGLGIAGIYSATPLYNRVIVNRTPGMLANNTAGSWAAAVQSLIENPDLRCHIARSALTDVEERYEFGRYSETLLHDILRTASNRSAKL